MLLKITTFHKVGVIHDLASSTSKLKIKKCPRTILGNVWDKKC